MSFSRITQWYLKHEQWVSVGAFFAGFIFDSLTLNRVDMLADNLWIIFHLTVASLGILFLNLYENKKHLVSLKTAERIHFWLLMAIQFAFGGLMSAFLVFYSRSGSFISSWPFILLLILCIVANEVFRRHYSRLVFQTSILFISLYLFSIFIVPVLVHRIGPWIFILSGVLTYIVFGLFLTALWYISRERFLQSKKLLIISIGGVTLLLNILYFTNLIPPIPLALKVSGVYYSIIKEANGNYTVFEAQRKWWQYFNRIRTIELPPEQLLYVFSAIFAPTNLNTTVIHHWQWYNEASGQWQSMDKVALPIVGGRDGGYRTFSQKNNLLAGAWRVDVTTQQNQLIGRVRFNVRVTQTVPQLKVKVID